MTRVGGLLLLAAVAGICHGMQSITDAIRDSNQTQILVLLQKALDQNLLDLSAGPYTILVPVDDAFNRLSTQEFNNIANDADMLQSVLQYHIIQGEIFSWDMPDGRILLTTNDHPVRVYNNGKNVYINNARVTTADLEATGAVVHLIDQVLDVPEGTIYSVARNPEYPISTFADMLDKTHYNRTLDRLTTAKYTVFMPSNEAFAKLDSAVLVKIQSSAAYLSELIRYHIHLGTLHIRSLDRNGTLTTLDSFHRITVSVDTDIRLNNVALLEQSDIDCDNGVVHIIDHVLIPSSLGSVIG